MNQEPIQRAFRQKKRLVEKPVEDVTEIKGEETVINSAEGADVEALVVTYYGNSTRPFDLENGYYFWWSNNSSTSYCGDVSHSTNFNNMKSFVSAGRCSDGYTKYKIQTYRSI